MGARHPNGTQGMIVDPTPDRLRTADGGANNSPIDRHVLCPTDNGAPAIRESGAGSSGTTGAGIEGEGGYKVLQKIRGGISKSLRFMSLQERAIAAMDPSTIVNSTSTLTVDTGETGKTDSNATTTLRVRARKSRILCMIYTVHLPPSYENANLRAQASTWGKKCDGFFAASNYTDHATGSIDLPHPGPETYGNIWQKTRSMWAYAHDHYRNDYDFFTVGGDDLYVAVDNLRAFVDGPYVMALEDGFLDTLVDKIKWWIHAPVDKDSRPRPLLFGTPIMFRNRFLPMGGPGYTLSRAALDVLVEKVLPSHRTDDVDPREDILLGMSLSEQRVYLSDATDAKDGQRYRESAETSYNFKGEGMKFLNESFGLNYPHGIDSVSDQQIGFHLKNDVERLKSENCTIADLIYRYHAILYDWCE